MNSFCFLFSSVNDGSFTVSSVLLKYPKCELREQERSWRMETLLRLKTTFYFCDHLENSNAFAAAVFWPFSKKLSWPMTGSESDWRTGRCFKPWLLSESPYDEADLRCFWRQQPTCCCVGYLQSDAVKLSFLTFSCGLGFCGSSLAKLNVTWTQQWLVHGTQ